MNSETLNVPSKKTRITGYIITGLVGAMLVASAAGKFFAKAGDPELIKNLEHIGMTTQLLPKIGLLELVCALLYLIPRTSILGAILVTGYMGGAILTHVRVGDPFVVQLLIGVFAWAGLYLREPRLRALIPLRS